MRRALLILLSTASTLSASRPEKGGAIVASLGADLEIVPVTLNGKLDRPLFGLVNGYLGAGAGGTSTSKSAL